VVRWWHGNDSTSHSKPAPQAFSATAGSTADGGLTADNVHAMAFGKRGYDEDEVDAFVTLVEQRLLRR
jgi:DivIVA domain-containing protein